MSRTGLLSPRLLDISGSSGNTAAVSMRNGTSAKMTSATAAG
jgi:hypothetical protein